MRLSRLILFTLVSFFLITALFLYINRDYVSMIYSKRQGQESDEPAFKYVEASRKDFSYIKDNKIFTLSGSHMTALDFDGNEIYQRVLKNDGYIMQGAGNYIFFIDDANSSMDVIDTENHLIMEDEPVNHFNGLRKIEDKIILFSDDGLNFETIIYDEYLDLYLSFLSKDASVDLFPVKDGFKVLNLRRTESGLSTFLSEISLKKEIKSWFELDGYVPIKMFSNSKGDIIVTDKEVILVKDGEVEARRVYSDLHAMEKIGKNYILIADGETIIVDESLNSIKKDATNGLDHVLAFEDKVLVYGGREFGIIGDDGIIKIVQTERDIEKIHYDGNIVVEFRNGFLIY